MMKLELGLRGVLSHEVAEPDLATQWRNDLPVLATPVLLWLAEIACMRAIEGCLAPGRTTLGYSHAVRHLAPTPRGWTVQVEAELVCIDGTILTFDVRASDGLDVVLDGRHDRRIVDRDRFVSRLEPKAGYGLVLQ
jgi:fluoroacetyl-CoA thioesterase